MSLIFAMILLAANVEASDIKIVIECPLTGTDGAHHKILLGFGQEYISKVDTRSAVVLDPDKILNGMSVRSINIDETMRVGSKYAVIFGGDQDPTSILKLQAVDLGAFEATLISEKVKNMPSFAGRCFMIDGPIASYVFKRRLSGQWGSK